MAVDKEYWNIPKTSEDFLTTQGTNLTVFVDHADNSLVWGLSASDVTAIAGVFIAIFALGVSLWQGYVARSYNIISLQPKLTIESNVYLGKCSFEYCMKNVGLGPAEITSFKVFVKDEEITCKPGESPINITLLEKIKLSFDRNELIPLSQGPDSENYNVNFDCVHLAVGELIPSNTTKILLNFRIEGAKTRRDIVSELLEKEKFDVQIGYRDLYNKIERVIKLRDSY